MAVREKVKSLQMAAHPGCACTLVSLDSLQESINLLNLLLMEAYGTSLKPMKAIGNLKDLLDSTYGVK